MRECCGGGRSADMSDEMFRAAVRPGDATPWRHLPAGRLYRPAASKTPIPPRRWSPPRRRFPVTQDINVLALVKGEERYIFLYDDERRSEALRTLGRFASNPELSFSWYDAAVLSQRIRQTAAEVRTVAEAETEAVPAALQNRRFKLPLASEEE
jgi:hypothetical protein